MKHSIPFFIGLTLLLACHSSTHRKEPVQPSETSGCWIDFTIGELPPANYYDAKDSIIRKWQLCYKRIEGGCEATVEEKKYHEQGNEKYFKLLAAKYGKDWFQRFNKEVKDLDAVLGKSNR